MPSPWTVGDLAGPPGTGNRLGAYPGQPGAAARPGGFAGFVEGNPGYYSRFGFQDTARVGITCQFNPPPGCFMFLELAPASLGSLHGTVFYQPEFQAVG